MFLQRRMKKRGGWVRENCSGKEDCTVLSCVATALASCGTWHSCCISPPYHLPTPSVLFNPKTGNSRLLLPSDPPPLSTALSPALGWAPSASGADTGHLSSPVTEPAKKNKKQNTHHASLPQCRCNICASSPQTFNRHCKKISADLLNKFELLE